MAFTQEDKDKMDGAAIAAEQNIKDTDIDAMATVAAWWNIWFPTAGHRRLARILLGYASKED